ncbi:MAG: hypothetical protein CMJ51_02600 [Planctomycetaceae bacterium]|nr:hypothetical protein [Planctomycetaceae bacterium]
MKKRNSEGSKDDDRLIELDPPLRLRFGGDRQSVGFSIRFLERIPGPKPGVPRREAEVGRSVDS